MRTPKFRNGVLMILPIFLFVALLMYGCTINPPPDLEKTTEDCPVSGQEIQEICGIKLEKILFLNGTELSPKSCEYVSDTDYGIHMAIYDRNHSNRSIDVLISNLDHAFITESEYELLDVWNESIFTSIYSSWKTDPYRASAITIFANNKEYYIGGRSPGHDYVGCTSKEDLIKIAKLFYDRTKNNR